MKYVYDFLEGNKDMANILGGKGANLAEMSSLSIPVPKGFTITTDACKRYLSENNLANDIITEIYNHLEKLEQDTNKEFGSPKNPLLVSIRSGSPVSMPGMMDTVLNLGLNDEIVESYESKVGNKRFIYDSYRRLISMYADVVKGYDRSLFEKAIDNIKIEKGYKFDIELTEEDLKNLVLRYKVIYHSFEGEDFPQDVKIQLLNSIIAVFKSWNNERAIYYRKINNISEDLKTAVNVQEMVYGNLNETCATGVLFTRNPATGEKGLFGEYLVNAQGEDVVAGIRTPKTIDNMKDEMPNCYEEILNYASILEKHYKDMQDIEFTIENNKVYILQTRNGKRTGYAAINICYDLVNEGLITKEEALLKVEPEKLNDLLHDTFNSEELKNKVVIAKGLAASPGAASGHIYFNAKKVIEAQQNNIDTILVRLETSPEDIEGMHHASGVLTIRGGMTSHAAVVARGLGICCVSGCSDITLTPNEELVIAGKTYHEGDILSIDGYTGNVYEGDILKEKPEMNDKLKEFMTWADEFKKLKVYVNADTLKDTHTALKFGAEGIGLCRTEHMFFEKERIYNFRKMILSTNKDERNNNLGKLLPYQIEDFTGLFNLMHEKEVVIRYLDPPLHEFLPKEQKEKEELASGLNITLEELENRIASLKEFNPMMGHRGARLSITYPEIAMMQTTAVISALINAYKNNVHPHAKIMVPLIGDVKEFIFVKEIIRKTADMLLKKANLSIPYEIGCMMEIPRACLLSDKLSMVSDFYSFGTNDLTQYTYGFSRDDAGKYLKDYYERNIFANDPFIHIDEEGIGILMQGAISDARMNDEKYSIGVCGEHAGDPQSIKYFNNIGVSYVSCSAYRILIARLAAAQAAINAKNNK